MKIVVIGAGRMGFSLVQQLEGEGHEVYVVERDQALAERVRTRLDAMAVTGSGSSLKALRQINAGEADLIIAASGSDEVNIVACLLGRQLGIPRSIARVQSTELMYDLRDADQEVLGVSEFINPSQITVKRLFNMVVSPGTTESAEFAEGKIILRAIRVNPSCRLIASPLKDFSSEFSDRFRVAAVMRNGEMTIPSGEFRLECGDVVYVLMRRGDLKKFLSDFHFDRESSDRVFIFGAGDIGCGLAAVLEDEAPDVIVIDPDKDKCDAAATKLSVAHIIHGSPLDQALMTDLKIEGADYFLGLCEMSDESNLSAALLAKRLGARNSVMLTGEPEYVELFGSLPLDGVISPLLLSVGVMLRSLRDGTVLSLFRIAGDTAEALEVVVQENSEVVGKPLSEIKFPLGSMIAVVTGADGSKIGRGDTILNPGDRVVVVALRQACDAIVQMLSAG